METVQKVVEIERQIAALKAQRDQLLGAAGLIDAEVAQILANRTPKRTLCQMLREMHDWAVGRDRTEIETCLLIAKKMDVQLRRYAGAAYSDSWYNAAGNFIR